MQPALFFLCQPLVTLSQPLVTLCQPLISLCQQFLPVLIFLCQLFIFLVFLCQLFSPVHGHLCQLLVFLCQLFSTVHVHLCQLFSPVHFFRFHILNSATKHKHFLIINHLFKLCPTSVSPLFILFDFCLSFRKLIFMLLICSWFSASFLGLLFHFLFPWPAYWLFYFWNFFISWRAYWLFLFCH